MNTAPHSATRSYRPDIDGLRAIAVLGVVLCHADPNLLPGGFVGVDVFFVISGFLITSILLRQAEAGTLSISSFYERRIRRIVPALMVVLAAVLVFGYFRFLPWDYAKLAGSAKYTLCSIGNIFFYRTSDSYFHGTNLNILALLHTWSLGIEEQFYFVYPLLFFLGCRIKHWRSLLPWAVWGLCGISFAWCLWQMRIHTKDAFFLLPYRAWELGMGALLALYFPRITSHLHNPRHATGIGLAGLALILVPMAAYSPATHFPGMNAFWPCLGTILVIASGQTVQGWGHRLLACKPLVFIGLISYSVYLWHWPLLAILSYLHTRNIEGPEHWLYLGIGALSIPLGYLSWRWIETPFRTCKWSAKKIFAAWGIVTALALGVTFAIEKTGGFDSRTPPEAKRLYAYKDSQNRKGMWEFLDVKKPAGQYFTYGDAGQPARIALWGDSHAHALAGVLDAMGLKKHQAIRLYGMPATMPLIGIPVKDPSKAAHVSDTLDLLEKDPGIKTVILACRWSAPLKQWGAFFLPSDDHEELLADSFHATLARLRAAGKRIVLVYPIPEINYACPSLLAQEVMFGNDPQKMTYPAKQLFFERHAFWLKQLDGVADGPDLIRIKPHEMLIRDGKFHLMTPKGHALLFDNNHLTQEAAAELRPILEVVFDEKKPSDIAP